MEPIVWSNAAVPDVFPAPNLLADQCHHDGVVHVVVGRITIGDILQREARNEANDVRIGGLEDPIDLAVYLLKMLDKCLDDNFCWIEHDRLRSVMLFRFRHFVTGYRSRAIWFSSCGRAPRADVKLQAPCPVWVKLRRTQCEQRSSGLPLKADIAQYSRHVSKVPNADQCNAINGLAIRSPRPRPSSVGGTSMPSALAVDRLMTSSNLVGCWTGKSAGLAPLRILCTYVAVCRDKSGR